MITPFCYDYQYKTESLYDSQFLGGTWYQAPGGSWSSEYQVPVVRTTIYIYLYIIYINLTYMDT